MRRTGHRVAEGEPVYRNGGWYRWKRGEFGPYWVGPFESEEAARVPVNKAWRALMILGPAFVAALLVLLVSMAWG